MYMKPLNYLSALLFILMAFCVITGIFYYTQLYLYKRTRLEDVIIYEPGDDGIEMMIKKSVATQLEKKRKDNKVANNKQKS